MWMIGDPRALAERGFTFMCVAEPSMLLEASLRDLTKGLRAGKAAAATASDQPLP